MKEKLQMYLLIIMLHCKKNLQNSYIFFLPNLSETGKPLCWQGIFWWPPEKEFFVFWRGKSIPLSAGVIFSSLLNVIFPYFPYFPIKFTGKLLEDSWLATGAPGRVAIKFGHWEKNLAPFVKLQVWNSVKFKLIKAITTGKIKGTKLLMN